MDNSRNPITRNVQRINAVFDARRNRLSSSSSSSSSISSNSDSTTCTSSNSASSGSSLSSSSDECDTNNTDQIPKNSTTSKQNLSAPLKCPSFVSGCLDPMIPICKVTNLSECSDSEEENDKQCIPVNQIIKESEELSLNLSETSSSDGDQSTEQLNLVSAAPNSNESSDKYMSEGIFTPFHAPTSSTPNFTLSSDEIDTIPLNSSAAFDEIFEKVNGTISEICREQEKAKNNKTVKQHELQSNDVIQNQQEHTHSKWQENFSKPKISNTPESSGVFSATWDSESREDTLPAMLSPIEQVGIKDDSFKLPIDTHHPLKLKAIKNIFWKKAIEEKFKDVVSIIEGK